MVFGVEKSPGKFAIQVCSFIAQHDLLTSDILLDDVSTVDYQPVASRTYRSLISHWPFLDRPGSQSRPSYRQLDNLRRSHDPDRGDCPLAAIYRQITSRYVQTCI